MVESKAPNRTKAAQLIREGYRVVWLRPYTKAPVEAGWPDRVVTVEDCAKANPDYGIGIALGVGLKPVYVFDADVSGNKRLSAKFRAELLKLYPELRKSFCRIGKAPKFMVPFRMVTPGIERQASVDFLLNGSKVQLEVLGARRQAAMIAIHEETKKPYTFEPVDASDYDPFSPPPSILTVAVDDLPVLPDDAPRKAIDLFERLAAEEGAVPQHGRSVPMTADDRLFLMPAFPPLGVSADTVERWFRQAEWDVNTRESWFSLLCQIKHEFQGREDEGLMLADRLSSYATNGTYRGFDDVRKTWDSINRNNEAGALTIRTLRRAAMKAAHKDLLARAGEATFEGLASKILLDAEDRIRYVIDEARGRGESGTWYFYNGLYWAKEDEGPQLAEVDGLTGKTNAVFFAKSIIYPYLREQAEAWDKANPEQAAYDETGARRTCGRNNSSFVPDPNPWRKLYAKLANTPDAVRKLMASFVGAYDFIRMSITDFDKITPGRETFPAANGIIDLRTGQAVQPDPELYLRRHSSVSFDPSATCPIFRRSMDQWMSGETDRVEWVQNLIGYLLLGDPRAHILTIFDGEGRNGKSVLLYVIARLLGQLHQVVPKGTLVTRSGSRGMAPSGPREDLMKLIGCRVATSSEFESGSRLREADVKAMTGQDLITARSNYGKFVDFLPAFSFVIATNHVPTITERSTAIVERLRILKFKETFNLENGNKDDNLRDKLDNELPGILNWAIEGARRVLALTPSVALAPTKNMLRDFREFDDENDHLGNWFAERLIKSDGTLDGARTELRDMRALWANWKDYAMEKGVMDLFSCQADLTRALKKRKEFGVEFKVVNGRKALRNYRLRTDEDSPDASEEADPFEDLGAS